MLNSSTVSAHSVFLSSLSVTPQLFFGVHCQQRRQLLPLPLNHLQVPLHTQSLHLHAVAGSLQGSEAQHPAQGVEGGTAQHAVARHLPVQLQALVKVRVPPRGGNLQGEHSQEALHHGPAQPVVQHFHSRHDERPLRLHQHQQGSSAGTVQPQHLNTGRLPIHLRSNCHGHTMSHEAEQGTDPCDHIDSSTERQEAVLSLSPSFLFASRVGRSCLRSSIL
mmetsp:Transcript_39327/g.87525  ORF Transcript_39327/g.87525 Transcript_39327/m.87525 type:complete len:220 (-) Transcript_39327:257-916(-)